MLKFKSKVLLLIIVLLLPIISDAQKLSAKSEVVYKAYNKLKKVPHAPVLQIRYIEVFPDNKTDFIDIFNPHTKDQLTEIGIECVKKFRKLGYDFTDSVLLKSILIGKDLPVWSAGPVDEIQKTIYLLADKNKQLFIDIVEDLKKEEQESLAAFLYSGPIGGNENFGFITDITKFYGSRKLYKIFEATPEEIKKQKEEKLKQATYDSNTGIQPYRKGL